jgi:tRNA A-37 threonylcarbamoyl transferase component Bud32/tetratricopeptide (TPR) repeat protein
VKCLDDNQVVAFIDGELPEEARAAVEQHLAECANCRRLMAGAVPPSPDSSTLADGRPKGPVEDLYQPGTQLSRYVIERVIGAGGMGVVYAARDPELDRKVAIKLLREQRIDGARGEAFKTRLVREARAMAQLTHPNVVTVFDVGTLGDRVFIVMELVAGSTLRGWLEQTPRSRREVLSVFRRIGEGLAAAHSAGIVHRDVKPENVLVADDGRVLVTDFGLARSALSPLPAGVPTEVGKLTMTGALIGTPAYMAPEQIDGGEATAQSDVFSYSVALYEALYHERPFGGATLTEVSSAIREGRVREAPRSADVPAWLRRVVLRGLNADPAQRPASIAELLHELARDPERRRRRILAGLGVLALAGGVGTFAWSRSPARTCRAGAARSDVVLAEPRLASLRARKVPTANAVLAGEASQRRGALVDRLSHFRGEWISAYEDACVATRVRGDQSEELLDRRMSCLDERLAGAGEMASLMERGDAALDGKLAATSLPESLSPCSDVKALLAAVRPPGDAAMKARVTELREENKRIRALLWLSEYKTALPRARALMEKSRQLGYPPMIAEAAVTLGDLLFNTSNYDEAARSFDEAIVLGEAAHDDRTVAQARISLLTYAANTGHIQDLYRLERDAEGAVARVGGEDRALRRQLLSGRARAEEALRHDDAAEALYREALSSVLKDPTAPPLEHGWAENDLGTMLSNRKLDEAMQHYDRALEIETPILGAHSPDMLILRYNRAAIVAMLAPSRELQRTTKALLDDALVAFEPKDIELARIMLLHSKSLMAEPDTRAEGPPLMEKALVIYRAVQAPDQQERVDAEAHYGEELLEVGRFAEGEPHVAIALAYAEKHDDPWHRDLRTALCVHARLLIGMHRAEEAKRELERAVTLRKPEMTKNLPRQDAREDFALALAVDELGDHARAKALMKKAEAGFLKQTFPEDERLGAVRAWLAAHKH